MRTDMGVAAAKADDELLRLWGKPLSERDARLCETLGWAKAGSGILGTRYFMTKFARGFEASIHVHGELAKGRCHPAGQDSIVRLEVLDEFFDADAKGLEAKLLLSAAYSVMEGYLDCVAVEDYVIFYPPRISTLDESD